MKTTKRNRCASLAVLVVLVSPDVNAALLSLRCSRRFTDALSRNQESHSCNSRFRIRTVVAPVWALPCPPATFAPLRTQFFGKFKIDHKYYGSQKSGA